MHVPNNFRFEWKSELNQTTEQFWFKWKSENWLLRSYNEYNAYRCQKESASKQKSASKQYVVVTNIMRIGLIRKEMQASKKDQEASSKHQAASS